MKKSVWMGLIIVSIFYMSSPLFAKEMKKLAQTGFQFLKIDADARGAGMAGAYVAMANNANAMFWNPAGIARANGYDIAMNQTNWFADIKHNAVAAIVPTQNWGCIGISFIYTDYGDIPITMIADNEAGYIEDSTYSPGGMAIGLAYARQFTEKLSIGGQAKYAYEHLGSNTVQRIDGGKIEEVDNTLGALAFDIGTLYYTGYKDLRISMSIRNFSKQIEYETEGFQMPLTFAVGVAMDILSLTNMNEIHKLTLALDAIHPRDYSERLHVGAEYMFMNTFAIRGGYKMNYSDEGLSAGFGINTNMTSLRIRFDYAYTDMGDFLGDIHRFSLGGSF